MLRTDQMADVLDPRFQKIFDDNYRLLPDYLDRFYSMATANQYTERFSQLGAMSDVPQFSSSVAYDDVYQGYDVQVTPLEFAKGIQVQRRLYDTDQHNLINAKPKQLARSFFRTKQKYAARPFNFAFSNDSFFYTHTEGVSLCSNSHTTTSGASTSSGFDNLVTTSLSAVSYLAARYQMFGFRDDRGNKIDVRPGLLLVPKTATLAESAYEIINSVGKVDTANNNKNFNQGSAEIIEWIELNSTTNWFLIDPDAMKGGDGLVWLPAVKPEFKMMEDFDTMVMKHRGYEVYGNAWINWRWILGAQVS